MMAIKADGNTITVAEDFVAAATLQQGYEVRLHGLPEYTFRVQADSCDQAHSLSLSIVAGEGIVLKLTGATIQRFESAPTR